MSSLLVTVAPLAEEINAFVSLFAPLVASANARSKFTPFKIALLYSITAFVSILGVEKNACLKPSV